MSIMMDVGQNSLILDNPKTLVNYLKYLRTNK